MASRPVVLVVEDEKAIRDLIGFHLEHSGYDAILAEDGSQGFGLISDRVPALVVLDLMLPDMDGLDILKTLRGNERTANLPVILLTARAEEADRILGLEIGADDYVVKPFSPRELMLRVERLIARKTTDAGQTPVVFGCLQLDEAKFKLTIDSAIVEVSATEMRLLSELLRCRGNVLSRSQLLQNAWGYMPNVTERTVDTHVKRLRQKLGSAAEYLETIRGVGYRWLENAPEETLDSNHD